MHHFKALQEEEVKQNPVPQLLKAYRCTMIEGILRLINYTAMQLSFFSEPLCIKRLKLLQKGKKIEET